LQAVPVTGCGTAISEFRNRTIKPAIPNKHSAAADPTSSVGDVARRHCRNIHH
jgi:hypothetical protein